MRPTGLNRIARLTRLTRLTRAMPARIARLAGALALAALGLATPARAAAPLASAADAATLALGQRVFEARCTYCHAYAGDARTVAATMLDPPPLDFTRARGLDEARILAALRQGRPGTAMASYAGLIDDAQMRAVAAYVLQRFVAAGPAAEPVTLYHSAANGWPDHERHADAFPFVRGELRLDTPPEQLTPAQQRGRALFVTACVSCHEGAGDTPLQWTPRPLSYPRPGFAPGQHAIQPPPAPAKPGAPSGAPVDAVAGPSVYAGHDRPPPPLPGLTAAQRRGERLFQANCAFCHGADGSGRNWIGHFLEPPARDLRALPAASLRRAHLRQVIREGLPGTSMPAWGTVLQPREVEALIAYLQRRFGRR